MTEEQKITEELITSIPFFYGFPPDLITLMLPYFELLHLQIGDKLIEQGNLNLCLNFMLVGKVDIFVGEDFILDISKVGQVFGEVSLACHQTSSASVIASKPSTFLRLSYNSIREIKNDTMWMHIYKNLAEFIAIKLVKTNDLAKNYKSIIDAM